MKKVNIEICEEYCDYSQIYQDMEVTFSFVKQTGNKVYTELFPKVLCRDYLNDCVASSKLGNRGVCGIYGFSIDECIDTEVTLLSVHVINREVFLRGLVVIRNLEKSFGKVRPLEVMETQEPSIFIIKGDPKWQSSTLTISLLTMLLRLINYSRPTNFTKISTLFKWASDNLPEGNDRSYVQAVEKIDLDLLLSHHDEILGEHPITGIDDSRITQTSMRVVDTDELTDEEVEELTADGTLGQDDSVLNVMHNETGIISFAKNVATDYDNKIHKYSSGGVDWANNYLRITGFKPENSLVKPGDTIKVRGIEYKAVSYVSGGAIKYYLDNTSLSTKIISVTGDTFSIVTSNSQE